MRRRDVLSTLALVPIAGCLDSGGGTTTTGTTTTEPSDSTTATSSTTTTDTSTTTSEADWSTEFHLSDITCASTDAESVNVSFSSSTIEVTGTTIGSDMCWVAGLDAVTYDQSTRELVVVVESHREADDDTACAQCIAAIEYAVTLEFSGSTPDAVEVVHARDGSEKTVIRATR